MFLFIGLSSMEDFVKVNFVTKAQRMIVFVQVQGKDILLRTTLIFIVNEIEKLEHVHLISP
jgi:hypothetical protein